MNTYSILSPLSKAKRATVHLGCKYQGPASFRDTNSGVYWEVLPKIQGDHAKLQEVLLKNQIK